MIGKVQHTGRGADLYTDIGIYTGNKYIATRASKWNIRGSERAHYKRAKWNPDLQVNADILIPKTST